MARRAGGEEILNKVYIIVGVVALVLAGAALFSATTQQKPSTVQTEEQVAKSPLPTESVTPASTGSQEEVMVTITASGFEPKTVTVRAGTKIIWTNKSGGNSNISSAIHTTHLIYPALNLGDIVNGASVSLVFDKEGTYKYHNHLNATQTGTVIVE